MGCPHSLLWGVTQILGIASSGMGVDTCGQSLGAQCLAGKVARPVCWWDCCWLVLFAVAECIMEQFCDAICHGCAIGLGFWSVIIRHHVRLWCGAVGWGAITERVVWWSVSQFV